MTAFNALFEKTVISAEANEAIVNLVKQFESECESLKAVRSQLAQLSDTSISALFNQIHFSRQKTLIQDIDKLESKLKDDTYLKLTTVYWSYLNTRILKNILNCPLAVSIRFDEKFVYPRSHENATEFNLENVINAVLEALESSKLTNALLEQAQAFGVADLENRFNSGRVKLTTGSLEEKVNQINDFTSVLNVLCESKKGLGSFVVDCDENFANETRNALLENKGQHIMLNKLITAKLFNNGNVQITLQSMVADAATKLT